MPRHPRLAPIRRFAVSLGLMFALSGCADGPFGLARYNPVLIDEWKQDEKYGASFHKRLEEMQEWESNAASLPAAQQMQISQQLNELVRSEQNVVLVAQAVRTQAALPQESALETLRFATTHPQSEVRIAACRAWARKGGTEAAETLARVLGSDTDIDVRVEAARELKRFPSPATIQSLGVALDDPNPALQHRCVESLKLVTGKNYGEDVRAWREYVASGQAQPSAAPSIADRVFGVFR
ncbi:MAG: HEAT repeat domain-containing protein [Pirellulales bacterium]